MNWEEKNGKLTKEFEFKNFTEAVEFIDKIKEIANAMDHHPDLFLHDYKYVTVTSITHSEGKITEKDYKLTGDIDKLLA